MARVRTCPALVGLILLVACGGGGGGGGVAAPSALAYAVDPGLYRAGEAIADNVPAVGGGAPTAYAVSPPLPTGLVLDPDTGVISGTPLIEAAPIGYTVTASNAGGQAQAVVGITVGAALPAAFAALRSGFEAAALVATPDVASVAKIALAPDGRLFFIEVGTGHVRLYDTLLGQTSGAYLDLSATSIGGTAVTLVTGSHRGLIGLCLDPDFTNNGYLYVMLSVEEAMQQSRRNVVLRFTDVPGAAGDVTDDAATSQAVVLDGLPMAPTNNGGELLFDLAGEHLLVSVGDAEDSSSAQTGVAPGTPATLGGKILRLLPTTPATVPGTNASGTFEWVRGLRNCYGMAVHPVTGGLFAGDNEGMEGGWCTRHRLMNGQVG